MARELEYSKILEDESSFQLVRTNPKLTGNVKFTVDSNDQMWLNSIDVNEELSKDQYKRVSIDPELSLASNMYRFFADGTTPSEIVFDLNESFEPIRTSKDFKDQFDFSDYFSGAKYLPSRRYTEKLSYFAPIYLKQDIPDYFVIFKVDDPLNKPIDQITLDYPYDRVQYIKDMFNKSSLIKTFKIGPGTKVGDYIRKYVEDERYPTSSLEVSFDQDSLTNWNGILYNSGVLGKRGENLSELYSQSNPLKYFEEFITLGYERNGVIFPNILNFEFIFDDDTSDVYEFNRYIGFYVNTIELSRANIDLDRAYYQRLNWENTPRFRRHIKEYEKVSVIQENKNGVIVPVKDLEVKLSDFKTAFSGSSDLYFNYLKDRNQDLYSIKISNPYEIGYDSLGSEESSAIIRVSDNTVDFGKFFGPDNLFLQDAGDSELDRGYSTQYIKVSSINHLDEIKIYHPRGTRSDSNGKYDLLTAAIGYTEVPDAGDFYSYIDRDQIIGHDVYYFNPTGLLSEITSAIAGCINKMNNSGLIAYSHKEYVLIKARVAGSHDNLYKIEFKSLTSNYSGVEIDSKTGTDLNGTLVSFSGGSKIGRGRLSLSSDHLEKLKTNQKNLLVQTANGWANIESISRYQDSITEINMLDPKKAGVAIAEYFSKIVISLEIEDSPEINYKNAVIYNKTRPEFGLLSFFPIKDFDFDFYSSEYANFPILDLYKDYFIPEGVELLNHDYEYQVVGRGTVLIDGVEYSTGDVITLSPSSSNYSYSIVAGNPFVTFNGDISTIGSRLDVPINDENKELKDFSGFFLLKDPSSVTPEAIGNVFELRDKHLNGITDSEYNYFKENESLDFAIKSKMIPYITKWAIPDSLDARSNPYRLNTELAFGFNNFSPDHEDRTQNPSNFTHEWFYVESNFNYVEDRQTASLNNSYFDVPFDLDLALTDDGYFIDYFTYTPSFNGEEIAKTQTRYSPILKNNQGVYEAFIKGFKINFKDYIDPDNIDVSGRPIFNPNSDRFEDYKFTVLLKTVKGDINDDTVPPIRYRMIEQQTFKFIILLIELTIPGNESIDGYWKNLSLGVSPSEDSVNTLNFLDQNPNLISSDRIFDSINGDYRIEFKNIGGLETSNMTYSVLYSLKSAKFNNLLDNYSNIKLSSKLNLSTSGAFQSGSNTIEILENPNYSTYPLNLKDEIHFSDSDNFIIAYNKVLDSNEFVDHAPGLIPLNDSPLISTNAKEAVLSDNSDIYLINVLNSPTFSIPTGLNANFFRDNYVFKIMAGGEGYMESLFRKLSFAEFKNRTNTLDSFIEYKSYEIQAGSLVAIGDLNWYSEIPQVSSISKKEAILPGEDDDKPSQVSSQKRIGYRYYKSSLDNPYEINRYEGGYAPLFRNVFPFMSKFNFTNNDIESIDSGNIRFNLNVDDFLKIKNFSHIKISDTKILTLESSDAYEPKYESSGEIAIGRSDYDLLMSNWDHGFHFKYGTKTESKPVAGSLRIEEDSSFVAKLIQLRDVIELENFSTSKVDKLKTINPRDFEIVYTENKGDIEGYINLSKAITSYLIGDGISEKFNEYLVNETKYIGNNKTIKDYVVKYIESNITKLYDTSDIEFYTLEDRSAISSQDGNINDIKFSFLNDSQRNKAGYKRDNSLQINKTDRLLLKFKFSKKVNGGLLVSPKIKIKFI